jgi:glycosyltransferase involved in cell wall biosynthesis
MRRTILHVITGLGIGGAEMALARIVPRIDRDRFENVVVGLGPDGGAAESLRRSGIETIALGAGERSGPAGAALELARLARARRPDLVHGWMYHGNLAAILAATGRLVWGIRQALYDLDRSPRHTRLAIRLGAHLSFLPDRILYNAVEARRQHEAAGYRSAPARVLPNGYDVDAFAGGPDARDRARRDLGIDADAEVVGFVARFHPVKNHAGFLEAAARLASRRPRARFVAVGPGMLPENLELMRAVERSGIQSRVVLLGPRDDVRDLVHAFDIATLASHGEAFPNALAEAMAAGVPCVAPDVGDVARLFGDTGIVVPPGDPTALARGWDTLLALDPERRRALGAAARERIRNRFGIDAAVAGYESVYAEILGASLHAWNIRTSQRR